jgi:hypothetical protein
MGLLDWLQPSPPIDDETRGWVARAVAAIDPMIRTVGGYEHRLAPAAGRAMEYCAALAERIPGPYDISRGAFASDPLVHALFGTADDIDTMLARSQCVREHLVGPGLPTTGQCCALLGMRHQEKSVYGASLSGEVLRADEPQRLLYFADHTLAEPSPDLPAARRRLREAMFDGLVKSFAAHVDDVRAERAGLYRDQVMESVRTHAPDAGSEAHTRRLAELRERLVASVDALSPPRLLETLVHCLNEPERYLSLSPVSLSVDRAGIIGVSEAERQGDDMLDFVELTSRDQRRWVVILAHIDREEAVRAVARFDEARRHIII